MSGIDSHVVWSVSLNEFHATRTLEEARTQRPAYLWHPRTEQHLGMHVTGAHSDLPFSGFASWLNEMNVCELPDQV